MTITSHLQLIIRSNFTPPDDVLPMVASEIAHINSIIQEEERNLMAINDTMGHLRKKQNHTYNKIQNQKVKYLRLASLSAPYRRTPPEIISLIFQYLIPGPRSDLSKWNHCLDVFTHVSKHWRNIATADPLLWKTLYLQISSSGLKQATGILQRWTSNAPLNNLHLTINCAKYIIDCRDLHSFHQRIHNCGRIVMLTILITHMFPHHHTSICSGMRLPNLLTLCIREERMRHNMNNDTTIRLNTPKLSSLLLQSVQPHTGLHQANLKMITKLTLDLNTRQITDYYNILQKCPMLRECSIILMQRVNGTQSLDNLKDICLSHLTYLYIEINITSSTLLSKISTPALKHVRIWKDPLPYLTIQPLIPFISRTPTITRIDITGYQITKEQLKFDKHIKSSHPHATTNWTDLKTDKWSQAGHNPDLDSETECKSIAGSEGFHSEVTE